MVARGFSRRQDMANGSGTARMRYVGMLAALAGGSSRLLSFGVPPRPFDLSIAVGVSKSWSIILEGTIAEQFAQQLKLLRRLDGRGQLLQDSGRQRHHP